MNIKIHTRPKSLPNGEAGLDGEADDGDPRLESEAKFLKTCKGDEMNEVLRVLLDPGIEIGPPGLGDKFSSFFFSADIFNLVVTQFLTFCQFLTFVYSRSRGF